MILPRLTSIPPFSTAAISNLLHSSQSPMQSPKALPSAAALATFCRDEKEASASGYPTHTRACCPSTRRPRLISPRRRQPTSSPFSGTSALHPVSQHPPLTPEALSPAWKRASPVALTLGNSLFLSMPHESQGQEGGEVTVLVPHATPNAPLPLLPANSLFFQSSRPPPAPRSAPPQASTVICQPHAHSTNWKALLLAHCPSTPTPITTCQQNGHCANGISAHHVLSTLLQGSLFCYSSVTQIHGQLLDFINRNHTWAKILNSNTPCPNAPSHPSCSHALASSLLKILSNARTCHNLTTSFCPLLSPSLLS